MKKRGRARRLNPVARAVRTPRFRPRVPKVKRAYCRKAKHRRPPIGPSEGDDPSG